MRNQTNNVQLSDTVRMVYESSNFLDDQPNTSHNHSYKNQYSQLAKSRPAPYCTPGKNYQRLASAHSTNQVHLESQSNLSTSQQENHKFYSSLKFSPDQH